MIAGEALRRALCATFATVEHHESRAWASVTFSGERHRLVLRLAGDGAAAEADRFLDGLAEREFALDGHILADIVLVADDRDAQGVRLTLEALTIAAD
jgi:hypothetical protein